jgi:hypothetical protein
VNRASIYIILFCLSCTATCLPVRQLFAQKSKEVAARLPFQDSVRLALENTRNTDAEAIGLALSNVWNGIGSDLQIVVMKQSKLMKKKGYRLRPHVQNYFGALVDAMNIEKIDNQTLASYLNVAGKVIENEDAQKGSVFFNNSRQFFRHHALHFEKGVKIYARDDSYHFDYIAIEVPVQAPVDTTSLDDLNTEDPANTSWED